jgi:hypothetical protein
MAKTQTPGVGLSADMQPRVVKHYGSAQKKTKARRVRQFGIPGLGRVAFSKDQGEANLFSRYFLQTRLSAIVRNPFGEIVEQHNLGSGLVTNVGVLALAEDWVVDAASEASFNLFPNLKWQAWGTGATAASEKDIKLQTLAAPNATEAVEATNTTTPNGEGKPKLVSTGKIKAESSLAITEWGIHTQKLLSAATGSPLVSVTATEGKVTATPLTASDKKTKGERLKIIVPTEATEIWGLITSNTTSVVTVPAFYKQSTGAVQAPVGTSPFSLKPVMFDHRVFSVINVESGNVIEFPWELEIKSGG